MNTQNPSTPVERKPPTLTQHPKPAPRPAPTVPDAARGSNGPKLVPLDQVKVIPKDD